MGVTLVDASSPAAACGAVFRLSGAPDVDHSVILAGGTTIHFKAARPFALATIPPVYQQADAFAGSLQAVQQGLDLLSIQGLGDFVTPEPDDWHLTWWQEPSGTVMRVTEVNSFGLTMRAKLSAYDSQGNEIPEVPEPPIAWDESYRYFRLSQVTRDLFDAYRNLYLALESILYAVERMLVRPNGRPAESERQWFIRALTMVGLPNLASFSQPGVSSPTEEDICDDLYTDMRTALFHAKGSRPHHRPHEPQDREQVSASFQRLTRLYLAIVASQNGVTRRSGGLTEAGFQRATSFLDSSASVYLLRKPAEESAIPTAIHDKGSVSLPTRRVPTLDRQLFKSLLASERASALSSLGGIWQYTLVARADETDVPLVLTDLEDRLTLTGIDRFEVHLAMRARQPQQPKESYST